MIKITVSALLLVLCGTALAQVQQRTYQELHGPQRRSVCHRHERHHRALRRHGSGHRTLGHQRQRHHHDLRQPWPSDRDDQEQVTQDTPLVRVPQNRLSSPLGGAAAWAGRVPWIASSRLYESQ